MKLGAIRSTRSAARSCGYRSDLSSQTSAPDQKGSTVHFA
jgi:hypothetical protein